MRQIEHIILHSSQKAPRSDFHYSVAADGTVYQERIHWQQGSHSGGLNKSCIEINVEKGLEPLNFEPSTQAALAKLILLLLDHHPSAKVLAIEEIGDHRVNPTREMNLLRRELSDYSHSDDYPLVLNLVSPFNKIAV